MKDLKKWEYDDGGRKAAGFRGIAADCGARSMSIALQIPYKQAYQILSLANKQDPRMGKKSARNGIFSDTLSKVLENHGWEWVQAPKFNGRKARASDLPNGRHIARMARHFAAVVDGVVFDTFDSTRKMVYGYWTKVENNP